MKLFKNKIVVSYILMLFLVAAVLVLNLFPANFLNFTIVFLSLLILPGFSLSRLFNLKMDGISGKLTLYFALGFVYAFTLISLSSLLALSINILLNLYSVIMGLLFLIAFIKDIRTKDLKEEFHFNFQEIFSSKSLPAVMAFLATLTFYLVVSAKGADFRGDPMFHLAFVQKAYSGQALTPANLTYVKDNLHIVYGFPIWHIFIALMAKIKGLDIFGAWYLLPSPLFLIVATVWYFLARQIFKVPLLATLALFLFLSFNKELDGYIFTRLAVPDSLNQFIMLPLLLAFSLNFIFSKTINYFILLLSFTLVLFMSLIHAPQYFYYFALMIVFLLVYAITFFRQKDYHQTLKKIFLVVAINLGVILLILVLLQVKTGFLSSIASNFSLQRNLLYGFDVRYLFFVPLLLPFIGQNHRIHLLLSSLLMVPIFSISWIQEAVMKIPNVGFAFIQRLPQNAGFYFFFWTLILGFIILFLDKLFDTLKSKVIKAVVFSAVLVILVLAIWTDFNQTAIDYYGQIIYPAKLWLNHYVVITSLLIILVTLFLRRFQVKKTEKNHFFVLNEPKNYFLVAILLALSFYTVIPSWRGFFQVVEKRINQGDFWVEPSKIGIRFLDVESFGGFDAFDFIDRLPSKSVFLVPQSKIIEFATVTDQYMVGYPQSVELTEYQRIYTPGVPIAEKIRLIKQSGIQYALLIDRTQGNDFDKYPLIFNRIYDKKIAIYEIDFSNLDSVYK